MRCSTRIASEAQIHTHYHGWGCLEVVLVCPEVVEFPAPLGEAAAKVVEGEAGAPGTSACVF